mgnify:CR=1 FL=1
MLAELRSAIQRSASWESMVIIEQQAGETLAILTITAILPPTAGRWVLNKRTPAKECAAA